MKITTETTKPEFTPITLKITIESAEELESLWHAFNVNGALVLRKADQFSKSKPNISNLSSCNIEFFNILDKLASDLSLQD